MDMYLDKAELMKDLIDWSLEQFPKDEKDLKQFYFHRGICETIKKVFAEKAEDDVVKVVRCYKCQWFTQDGGDYGLCHHPARVTDLKRFDQYCDQGREEDK